ncbi:MAG: metal-sulfur cluster assembly factor [Thermodesulfobacteriota bacterium]
MSITEEKVYEVLGDIYDPEIPIDIVNLGLVYGVQIENDVVNIDMTMTSPGCPAATQIVTEAKLLLEDLPEISAANIEIVWDPPWDPSKMSEAAKESLGMF